MSDNDPTAGGAWNDGCDFAMTQLCLFLGVNQNDVRWDAATETVDGDVQAVIGNILRAKFGEDWGPDDTFSPAQPSVEAMKAAVELEIHAALGRVQTVEIGRMIQKAIDASQPSPAATVTDGSIQEGDVLSYTMTDGVGKVTAHVRPHNGSSAGNVREALNAARRHLSEDCTDRADIEIARALSLLNEPQTAEVLPFLESLKRTLKTMKLAHSKGGDRLMSVWTEDMQAVEEAISALAVTRPESK